MKVSGPLSHWIWITNYQIITKPIIWKKNDEKEEKILDVKDILTNYHSSSRDATRGTEVIKY